MRMNSEIILSLATGHTGLLTLASIGPPRIGPVHGIIKEGINLTRVTKWIAPLGVAILLAAANGGE
jgi:hypothetical protein